MILRGSRFSMALPLMGAMRARAMRPWINTSRNPLYQARYLNTKKELLIDDENQANDIIEIKSESNANESDTSAETTGVIDKDREEILLFYNHIYPVSVSNSRIKQYLRWWHSPLQARLSNEQLKQIVEKISSPLPEGAKAKEFIPLKRDCGAFVKFTIPRSLSSEQFVGAIQENVLNWVDEEHAVWYKKIKNLVSNNYPSVYPVKGTPWIEDLRRFPSTTLKVMFEGNPLTEEELYLLFRRYGLIVDIIPEDKFATVVYRRVRSAVSAKNCITGITLNKGKTVLHIQYVKIKRVNYITDFISAHQRITIPIIIALLAGTAVLIFDPIREWFIEEKITKKYSLENQKFGRIRKLLLFPFDTIKEWYWKSYDYFDDYVHSKEEIQTEGEAAKVIDSNLIWVDRYEKAKQLKLWIFENVGTFIIVKGPKGSGKNDFVLENCLQKDEKLKSKILYIDCDKIVKSRSTNSLMKNTASQIGYFPLFTWTNSVSQFVDLGVQSITGQKSGLSESKETQFKNIFALATQAIRSITQSEYKRYETIILKKNHKLVNKEEAVELLKYDGFLQQHPETKPIVVIDKFGHNIQDEHDFVHPVIAEWASGLIQINIAHVIFITSDVGSMLILNEALPNQVFKLIVLSDASFATSKKYLQNQLKVDDASSFAACVEPLGGRMLDLQAFIRRVKSGEEPQVALQELVNQAAEQITTFFINKEGKEWDPCQVWVIMKLLTEQGSIDFQLLLKNPLFSSSYDTLGILTTLEKHDLISLTYNKGVLDKIKTGRPLYQSAFKNLIEDKRVFRIYEQNYIKKLISMENAKIKKLEEEIQSIYKANLKNRVAYLSDKVDSSNKKIMDYEKQVKSLNEADQSEGKFLGLKLT